MLRKLASEHNVIAAVTGLDKPVGRGHRLMPSPVKVAAEELGIPVLQFERVSRAVPEIRALGADLGVTAAFGQILSEEFLSVFPEGVINVHASLLPRWRGASPIQWAILAGDKCTGITVMKTVKEVDAGDMLLKRASKSARAKPRDSSSTGSRSSAAKPYAKPWTSSKRAGRSTPPRTPTRSRNAE